MTHLKIPARSLKVACAAAEGVLPRNSPAEQYNCVGLHVDPSGASYCHGTDGRVAAVAPLPGPNLIDDMVPYDMLLSRSCLQTIAMAGDDDEIALRHTKEHSRRKRYTDELGKVFVEEWYDQVSIKVPHATYNLDVKTLPIPAAEVVGFEDCVEFHPEHFLEMIALLGGIHDDAEYKHNFSGIHLAFSPDSPALVRATATDGRRVGMGEFPAVTVGAGPVHGKSEPVIPRHLLKAVRGPVGHCESTVRVKFTERRCYIGVGDVIYYGVLAEGRFPSVSRGFEMFRSEGTRAGAIDRERLIQSLSLARICTNRKLDVVGVRISAEPTKMTFESSAPEVGQAHVIHDEGIKKPFCVTVDPVYLLPVLAAIRDPEVSLTVIDDVGLMVETKTFSYIVMGVNKA